MLYHVNGNVTHYVKSFPCLKRTLRGYTFEICDQLGYQNISKGPLVEERESLSNQVSTLKLRIESLEDELVESKARETVESGIEFY